MPVTLDEPEALPLAPESEAAQPPWRHCLRVVGSDGASETTARPTSGPPNQSSEPTRQSSGSGTSGSAGQNWKMSWPEPPSSTSLTLKPRKPGALAKGPWTVSTATLPVTLRQETGPEIGRIPPGLNDANPLGFSPEGPLEASTSMSVALKSSRIRLLPVAVTVSSCEGRGWRWAEACAGSRKIARIAPRLRAKRRADAGRIIRGLPPRTVSHRSRRMQPGCDQACTNGLLMLC